MQITNVIIIINDIYKEQTSPMLQMRQVSRCTITVILEQEHFQSFPEHWQWNVQQSCSMQFKCWLWLCCRWLCYTWCRWSLSECKLRSSHICRVWFTTCRHCGTRPLIMACYPVLSSPHSLQSSRFAVSCCLWQVKVKVRILDIPIAMLTWEDLWTAALHNHGSGSWLAWASGTVQPYTACDSGQMELRHSTTDIPPPQSATFTP